MHINPFFTTKFLAIDSETTGLSPHEGDRPFAISMTSNEGEDYCIRFKVDPFTRKVQYDDQLIFILKLLEFRAQRKLPTIFHNASFDLAMLHAAAEDVGYPWSALDLPHGFVVDTVILAHAINSSRDTYALKPLCKAILNVNDDDQADLQKSTVEARKTGKKLGWKLAQDVEADYHLADPKLCQIYAIRDTQRTMKLFKTFAEALTQKPSPWGDLAPVIEMEHSLQLAVLEMNIRGVRIDPKKCEELRAYYTAEVEKNKQALVDLGYPDLNPSSPKQKMEIFYNQLGFEPIKKKRKDKEGNTKQTLTIDKGALARFATSSPLASVLLNISEAQHQLKSFIEPFMSKSQERKEGRFLYPNFNSVGPATGRLSCSGVNLQNITSASSPSHKTEVELRARECFIPREGCAWMLADYAQVEVWVAAFLSGDKVMCDALLSGNSVHDITCDNVFGAKPDFKENRPKYRKLAKILTFSILYGSGPKALSELLGATYEEAKVYYNNFWNTYKGLKAFSQKLEAQVKGRGYVQDVFGRVYFLPKGKEYKALNYVIQGTAAGILKRAHLAVFKLLKERYPTFKVILSIHDELVTEGPKNAFSHTFVGEVLEAMSGEYHKLLNMPNPFKVEASFVVSNWGNKIAYHP